MALAADPAATRTTATDIENYLQTLLPWRAATIPLADRRPFLITQLSRRLLAGDIRRMTGFLDLGVGFGAPATARVGRRPKFARFCRTANLVSLPTNFVEWQKNNSNCALIFAQSNDQLKSYIIKGGGACP